MQVGIGTTNNDFRERVCDFSVANIGSPQASAVQADSAALIRAVDAAQYFVVLIGNAEVANALSEIVIRSTDANLHNLADTNLRAYVAGSLHDVPWSSLIVRISVVTIERLWSGRLSYVKAILVHSRGKRLATPCTQCLPAYDANSKQFTAFLGCVAMPSYYDHACSNCIWNEGQAKCSSAISYKAHNPPLSEKNWTRAQFNNASGVKPYGYAAQFSSGDPRGAPAFVPRVFAMPVPTRPLLTAPPAPTAP